MQRSVFSIFAPLSVFFGIILYFPEGNDRGPRRGWRPGQGPARMATLAPAGPSSTSSSPTKGIGSRAGRAASRSSSPWRGSSASISAVASKHAIPNRGYFGKANGLPRIERTASGFRTLRLTLNYPRSGIGAVDVRRRTSVGGTVSRAAGGLDRLLFVKNRVVSLLAVAWVLGACSSGGSDDLP